MHSAVNDCAVGLKIRGAQHGAAVIYSTLRRFRYPQYLNQLFGPVVVNSPRNDDCLRMLVQLGRKLKKSVLLSFP